jgi:hypothetical protein
MPAASCGSGLAVAAAAAGGHSDGRQPAGKRSARPWLASLTPADGGGPYRETGALTSPESFPAYWPAAALTRAISSAGTRPRSFTSMPCALAHCWTSVLSTQPAGTFHTRRQVEMLLDGLDILRLDETERDGHAFSGPKHWHTFDILARKPISKHPPAPASR